MSLFKSLFPLARENALTILVVAEGEQLRVNVMPKSKDEKATKTLYPLSLLASPDELDRDFAEAVQIYAPGSQSVLEQAAAASEANGSKKPALPAPAKEKGKPGRRPKALAAPAPEADPAATQVAEESHGDDAPGEDEPEVDSRQTRIPGLDDESGGDAAPAAATDHEVAHAAAEADDALDIL